MVIEIENIKFSYNKTKPVLNGISFKADQNNTIAIVGASGCGKSTFLRLLSGIIRADKSNSFSGRITIDGCDPEAYTRQGHVSFMFQEPSLMPNLTVKQNIAFPLVLKKHRVNGEIDELLETVRLKEFEDYLPYQLSGGMKTRVALARTFSTNPKLLLLDEPFSALDIRWRYLLYKELETLQQKYASTIVIVTHDIHEALLLANHVLVFGQNGTLVKELHINQPLPRASYNDVIKNMQQEYLLLQELIMNN